MLPKIAKTQENQTKQPREALTLFPMGWGKFAPPRTNPLKAQNWLGPEGQAFAAFIII